jgi:hypothetical protein
MTIREAFQQSIKEIDKEPCLSPLGRVVWLYSGRDDRHTGMRIGMVYYRRSKNDVDDEQSR